jgi:hypothetical protein
MLQLRLEVTGPGIAFQSSIGSVGFQPTLEIDLIKWISRDNRGAALSKSAFFIFNPKSETSTPRNHLTPMFYAAYWQ